MGMGMEEGTVVEWLVEDGARVELGSPLYVLSTDKVDTEIESPLAGVIRLLVAAGGTYPVGTPIAQVEEDSIW
jgi:pyruvate/2-oxoglutarate dehydrogenase complex dihydrolipoamide acyltransferase (E2) component